MANDLYNDAFPTSLVNLRSTNDAAYLSTFNSVSAHISMPPNVWPANSHLLQQLFYQSAEPTWFANLPSNVKDFEYTYRPPSATPTSSVSSSPMPSSLFGSSSIPPGPSSMITSPPGQAAAPPPVTAVKTQFVTVGPHNGPNNNSPSSPQSTSSGLSTGAKAGIGVGVALGVLALIGFLVFFLLRRRRNKKNKATTERNMAQTPAHGSNYQSLHPSYQASQQQQGYYPPPQQGQYDPNYNPNYSAGYMQQPYTQTGSPPPAQYGYYDQKVENGRSPPMTNTDSSAFVSSQPTGTSAGRSSVPAATEPSELPGRTSAEDVRPELPTGDR